MPSACSLRWDTPHTDLSTEGGEERREPLRGGRQEDPTSGVGGGGDGVKKSGVFGKTEDVYLCHEDHYQPDDNSYVQYYCDDKKKPHPPISSHPDSNHSHWKTKFIDKFSLPVIPDHDYSQQ